MSEAAKLIWMDMTPERLERARPFVTQGPLASPPRTPYIRLDAPEVVALVEALEGLDNLTARDAARVVAALSAWEALTRDIR